MKVIIVCVLAVVSLSAIGQSPLTGDARTNLFKDKMTYLFKDTAQHYMLQYFIRRDSQKILIINGLRRDSLCILQPDRMPCLVPAMANVARMPTRRMNNADPMVRGGTQSRIFRIPDPANKETKPE